MLLCQGGGAVRAGCVKGVAGGAVGGLAPPFFLWPLRDTVFQSSSRGVERACGSGAVVSSISLPLGAAGPLGVCTEASQGGAKLPHLGQPCPHVWCPNLLQTMHFRWQSQMPDTS